MDELPVGVASDDLAAVQEELLALRQSAGPFHVVGFVYLTGETRTGFDPSGSQPYCTGAGEFEDVAPGSEVLIYEQDGGDSPVGKTVLYGSTFDSHLGCVLWFSADVPKLAWYQITVGTHVAPWADTEDLQQNDWIAAIWADQTGLDANCGKSGQIRNCLPLS